MNAWIRPEHIAVFIPIFVVAGAIVIVVTAIIVQGRKKDLEHRERLAAMEKGIPLPEPIIQQKQQKPAYSGRRAVGLIFVGIGLALTIILWTIEGSHGGVWGLLPLFMGLGLIIAAILDKREFEEIKARERANEK